MRLYNKEKEEIKKYFYTNTIEIYIARKGYWLALVLPYGQWIPGDDGDYNVRFLRFYNRGKFPNKYKYNEHYDFEDIEFKTPEDAIDFLEQVPVEYFFNRYLAAN